MHVEQNSNILARKHALAMLLWGFNYPCANLVIFAVESTFVWNVTQRTSVVVAAAAEVFVADFGQQLLSLQLLLASTSHNNSFNTEPVWITFLHNILNKFDTSSVAFVHPTCSPCTLRTKKSFRSLLVISYLRCSQMQLIIVRNWMIFLITRNYCGSSVN